MYRQTDANNPNYAKKRGRALGDRTIKGNKSKKPERIIGRVAGRPVFSKPIFAVNWAAANGFEGYHTYTFRGVTGYVGGASHTPNNNFSTTKNTRITESLGETASRRSFTGSFDKVHMVANKIKNSGLIEDMDENEISSLMLSTIAELEDDIITGKKVLKCKKRCGGGTGKCVLGGCFTLKGFPPKKFSWTWPI